MPDAKTIQASAGFAIPAVVIAAWGIASIVDPSEPSSFRAAAEGALGIAGCLALATVVLLGPRAGFWGRVGWTSLGYGIAMAIAALLVWLTWKPDEWGLFTRRSLPALYAMGMGIWFAITMAAAWVVNAVIGARWRRLRRVRSAAGESAPPQADPPSDTLR